MLTTTVCKHSQTPNIRVLILNDCVYYRRYKLIMRKFTANLWQSADCRWMVFYHIFFSFFFQVVTCTMKFIMWTHSVLNVGFCHVWKVISKNARIWCPKLPTASHWLIIWLISLQSEIFTLQSFQCHTFWTSLSEMQRYNSRNESHQIHVGHLSISGDALTIRHRMCQCE